MSYGRYDHCVCACVISIQYSTNDGREKKQTFVATDGKFDKAHLIDNDGGAALPVCRVVFCSFHHSAQPTPTSVSHPVILTICLDCSPCSVCLIALKWSRKKRPLEYGAESACTSQ